MAAGSVKRDHELVALLRAAAEPLAELSDPAFADPFERFAGAKVVLLGEATHGTSEFYTARAAITRRLIERHGFCVVALEADWPDAAMIDARIRRDDGPGGAAPEDVVPKEAFHRFPTWMWRNREVARFAATLRALNGAREPDERVELRGLDVYSLGTSMRAVLDHLDAVDPRSAAVVRERYGCLTPWQARPERYARELAFGAQHPCEQAVTQALTQLLNSRLASVAQGETFFDAEQNARIVRAAEHYYRIMYRGSTESWNVRDRHMFDTLQRLLDRRGPDAKAIVWAHNSHIGNAAATAMGWEGEFNIGELARTAYGERAALIGFSTDTGTVAAASEWDGAMEIKTVRPARDDSHEALFRATGHARSLTDLRRPELRAALDVPRLERAIGVIYRPETERSSHYFECVLPEQFDAFVWFARTRAVTPLAVEVTFEEVPETFPSGL